MKRLGVAALAVAMVVVGTGVYLGLAALKTKRVKIATPITSKPILRLPGTMYLVQAGAIYRLKGGAFELLQPAAGQWSQPALVPDGSGLVAVSGGNQFSDLYLLDTNGKVVRQLTQDKAPYLQDNLWAAYPRVSPDSQTVYFSRDLPKYGYQVDFSIWSFPLASTARSGVNFTNPNSYTGGDVEARPLASGALLYVKYSIDLTGVYSQLWLQRNRYDPGTPLTDPSQDCREPALSPRGDQIAMICTQGKQESHLVVASFDGNTLGPLRDLISNQLVAVPTWAPDGSGIAYLAPDPSTSRFQLWWLPGAAVNAAPSPSPAASPAAGPSTRPAASPAAVQPLEVTTSLDLDPLSQPAWAA